MKIVRKLSGVLAAVALGAFATAGPIDGTAAGQWTRVSWRSTTVRAQMTTKNPAAVYSLDALLIGTDKGQIYGTIEKLASQGGKDGNSHPYAVLGDYVDLGNGNLFVHSQILLDLTAFGVPMVVPVGVLDGQLVGAGTVLPSHVDQISFMNPRPVHPGPLQPIESSVRDDFVQPTGKFIGAWQLTGANVARPEPQSKR